MKGAMDKREWYREGRSVVADASSVENHTPLGVRGRRVTNNAIARGRLWCLGLCQLFTGKSSAVSVDNSSADNLACLDNRVA